MTESEKNEYVTKGFLEERLENILGSISRSFDKVEERFDRLETSITKILESIHRNEVEHQEFRKIFIDHDVSIFHNEGKINNLTERVEIIEKRA